MNKMTCDKCGSNDSVKLNQHQCGIGSEHEHLCRGCRFHLSNARRNTKARTYVVSFTKPDGSGSTYFCLAKSAGQAIEFLMRDMPDVEWDRVHMMTLIRKRRV